MNVNRKNVLVVLFCLFVFNIYTVNAFDVYDSSTEVAGDAWHDTDEYGEINLKYYNQKLYYCTQPTLSWPSTCPDKGWNFSDGFSAATSYIIQNDTGGYNITYTATQKAISKLLYNYWKTDGRANWSLSTDVLTYTNDINAQLVYNNAVNLLNNSTKVNFLSNELNFSNNIATVNYTLTAPFDLECTVDNGASVSIDKTNKTITINSNGRHMNNIITLSCRTVYQYKAIEYHECTGQDIVKETDSDGNLYGDFNSISSLPLYTFSYTGNGGIGTMEPQAVLYGGQLTIRNNVFVRNGYRFTGYAVNNDDTGKWYCSGWKSYDECAANWSFIIYPVRNQYNIDYSWNVKNDNSNHSFTFYAQWEREIGTLSIKKVNSSNSPIINKNVRFKIYSGTGCNTEYDDFSFNTGGDGLGAITLPTGSYSIKEITAPSGYVTSGSCINVGNIGSGATVNINVVNKTECENDFDTNSSIVNRLYLYKDKYPSYNNLLNFTITNGTQACSNTEYNLTSSNLCLSSSRKLLDKSFNNNDLSAYNDTLFYNNKNHYCLTEFELNGSLGTSVTSGQFVSTNTPLSTGVFTKTCYIYKDDITTVQNSLTINEELREYIGVAKLDGKSLNDNISSNKIYYSNEGLIGEFYKYEASYNIEYSPWDVYAVIGNGEVRYEDCPSCKYLGKGIISKFSPDNKTVEIDFKIEKPTKNVLKFGQTSKCSYTSIPEITKENHLQLEFRIIDTNTPFDRKTKSNWCNENDCSSNNSLVESVIKSQTANNSINKTNEGALYTNQTGTKKIVLTPDLIQKIKEYNQQNSYDDYSNLQKDQTETGEKFKSSFLKQFNIIKTR